MSVDAYPAGPYGLDTHEIIDSFSFMGFSDGGDPFTEVHLSDFYDPDGTGNIKALFITLGWNGCPAALQQAGRMNTWDTQYRSEGLRQLCALHSDLKAPDFHFRQAKESTARDWIATYSPRYDVVIDPTYQLNGGVLPATDPHGWLVDTKTMKITQMYPGAPGSLFGLDKLLS
jgi:hypothetical protein